MVGDSEDAVLAVVDRIYASVERQELWPDTIRAVGELVGGRRDLWGVNPDARNTNAYALGTGCHPTVFLSRNDLAALDQYAAEFGALIVHFLKIAFVSLLRDQTSTGAREAVGLRMVQRYPQAFLPFEGTSAPPSSKATWRNLLAALWEDGRIFTRDNLRCMRVLLPHLERALRLQTRFTVSDLRADMISGAFDCLTIGVAFVDRSGRPLWLNKRAREITNGPDLSQLATWTEHAGRSRSGARSLNDFIADAVGGGKQGLVAIDRGLDVRPILLVALPLRPAGFQEPSAQLVWGVVFIIDPDRADNPNVDSLRQAFDLTYREAHVAIAVAQGNGLQAAADAMGVALTTARSQLQQVFAKTGTKQQAELAALVNRTLTLVRYD